MRDGSFVIRPFFDWLDEGGGCDLGEGEVLGGAAGALLPGEEEFSVAIGEAGGGVYVELGEGAVDPVGGAFEFGVGADGGFVDDEVGEGGGAGGDGVGPLGAVLLVGEGWGVAELLEDLGEGGAVGEGGFGLDADLVAGGVDGILVGHALVGEGAEGAVLADAEEMAFGAEVAGGCVVQSIVLEGAGSVEVEAKLGEAGLEGDWIGDGELEFDLGTLHD